MKTILMIILITYPLFSGNAGDQANVESRYIVDMPTAGVTEKGHVSIYANAFTQGGLMMELNTGIFTNFNMAISYSATNIIGSGEPSGPDYPGVHLKYRFLNEKENLPAIAIGVSTQGRGEWRRDFTRFQTLSPGVYVAASKNFIWAVGNLAVHSALNYSFEPQAEQRSVNVYGGIEQSLGSSFAILVEFNSTLDDLNNEVNSSIGLLNTALRWSVSNGLTIELQIRDILGTQKNIADGTRFLTFEYSAKL